MPRIAEGSKTSSHVALTPMARRYLPTPPESHMAISTLRMIPRAEAQDGRMKRNGQKTAKNNEFPGVGQIGLGNSSSFCARWVQLLHQLVSCKHAIPLPARQREWLRFGANGVA